MIIKDFMAIFQQFKFPGPRLLVCSIHKNSVGLLVCSIHKNSVEMHKDVKQVLVSL